MAAKGAIAKQEIMDILMKGFGDKVFLNGKELRINWAEDGEPIQLAITLTAKKDFVKNGISFVDNQEKEVEVERCGAPTEEEVAKIIEFMREIGGLIE